MTKSTVLGAFPGIDAKAGTKKEKIFHVVLVYKCYRICIMKCDHKKGGRV